MKALKVGRLNVEGWKTRRAACLGCGVDRRGKILTAGEVDRGPWRLPGTEETHSGPGLGFALFFLGAVLVLFVACFVAGERIDARQTGTDAGLETMAEDLADIRAARLRMEATCPR